MAKKFSYGICPYIKNENGVFILLIQPKGHKEYGFAKGHIELNETEKQCAIRELFEETGIVVEEKFLENFYYQNNKRKDVGIFLTNIQNIDLDVELNIGHRECYEIKLFNIKNDININKNQSQILNQIRDFFKSHF